jgi:hypothetical protein
MEPFIIVVLALLIRALAETCREHPSPGYDFLALMAAGVLPESKKAHGRAQQKKRKRKRR